MAVKKTSSRSAAKALTNILLGFAHVQKQTQALITKNHHEGDRVKAENNFRYSADSKAIMGGIEVNTQLHRFTHH